MAKYFIYSNENLYGVEPVGGDRQSQSDNFVAASGVTGESRLTDVSISTGASIPQYDAVRFDMGGTITAIDAVAVYSNAVTSSDVHFFNSSSDGTNAFGSGDANFITGSSYADLSVGWNVKTGLANTQGGSAATARYFYIYSNVATQTAVTEVIIGNKLNLTNVTLSGSEGVNYGNETLVSEGGNEFSHQKHGAKKFWHFSLNHVSETYKTSLEAMRDAVDGSHYKFLYYDGSSYNYVRMSTDSLRFKEVAVGVYNTRIKLTEQLS
tara:strand:- start:185 stop:982 length:798 start_codon:yes stop_codon:yes gene_type:complete